MSNPTSAAENPSARLRAFLKMEEKSGDAAEAPDSAMTAAAPTRHNIADIDNVADAMIDDEPIEIPASDLSDFWEEGWHLVEIIKAERATSKSGNAQLVIGYRGLSGVMAGSYKTDYWPLAGKGARKTGRVAQVLGLRCPDTGAVKIPSTGVLLGRRLCICVVHKQDEYEPEPGKVVTTTKDEIRFPDGYAREDQIKFPEKGDLFAEGAALAATG